MQTELPEHEPKPLPCFPRTKITSKAKRLRLAAVKPKAPEAPRLAAIPRLASDGHEINYFEQFEADLRKRGYNRDLRRRVLTKVSERKREAMRVEIVPAPAIDARRSCGSCGQPMMEEFHPAANSYLCVGITVA